MAGHRSGDADARSVNGDGPAPVVVSGLGGSGTRVVAQILEALGLHMGDDKNSAADNLLFTLLMKRPRDLIPVGLDINSARAEQLLRLFGDLTHDPRRARRSPASAEVIRAAVHQVRYGIERPTALRRAAWSGRRIRALLAPPERAPSVGWGFKEPTAHLFLPALGRIFQGMRYIHVMRDPRDYAIVPHNQYALWAGAFSSMRALTGPLVRRQLVWWALMNERALHFTRERGTPTLVIRLEELCDYPEKHVERLASFTGLSCHRTSRDHLAALVRTPDSRGRGAKLDLERDLTATTREQMTRLGYSVS